MEKFEEHADKFGVQKFPMQEIESLDLKSTPKVILTKEAEFKAKTVIIACGAQPMKLGVPGEAEFVGRGVSYCAVTRIKLSQLLAAEMQRLKKLCI